MTDKPEEEILQDDINTCSTGEATVIEGTQLIEASSDDVVHVICEPVIEICIESNEIRLQNELNIVDEHASPENGNESEIINDAGIKDEAVSVYDANSTVLIATEVHNLLFDNGENATNDANDTEAAICKTNINTESKSRKNESFMDEKISESSQKQANITGQTEANVTCENNSSRTIAMEVQKMLESLQDELPNNECSQNPSSVAKNVNKEKVFKVFQVIGQEEMIVDLSSKKVKEKKCEKKRDSSTAKTLAPSLPPTIQCSYCVKKYHTAEQKDGHEKFHTEERPCKCTYCEKRFTTIGGQRRHERKFHTGEKLLTCTFCEKTFATATAIRRHERVHTDDRPFECAQCDATFKDSTDLRRHERRHTGEKPFKCKICKRPFTVRSAMNRHQRVHTGAKPYLCDLCGQAFTDRFSLKQHIKRHSLGKVYKCGICDEGFSFRYHLNTHKRECGNNLTIKDVENKVTASLVPDKETDGTAYLQLTEGIVGSQLVYYLNPISTSDKSSN